MQLDQRSGPDEDCCAAAAGGFRGGSSLSLLLLLVLSACAARTEPGQVPDPALDARIRAEVEARLAAEPSIEATRIRVEVNTARVMLHGSVLGMGAWSCAIRNAGLVQGVAGVVDYLVIERGPREVRCLARR